MISHFLARSQSVVVLAAVIVSIAACKQEPHTSSTNTGTIATTAYVPPTAAERRADSITAQRLVGVWHGSETGKGPLARGVIRFVLGGYFSARFWQTTGALRAPAQGSYQLFKHELGISTGPDFDARFSVQFLDDDHIVLTSTPLSKAWPQFVGVPDTLRRSHTE